MIKKLLNIYDNTLYEDIQVWCKRNKTDANAFINKAMEEKAIREKIERTGDGVSKQPVSTLKEVDFDGEPITEVDFADEITGQGFEESPEVKDDLTF